MRRLSSSPLNSSLFLLSILVLILVIPHRSARACTSITAMPPNAEALPKSSTDAQRREDGNEAVRKVQGLPGATVPLDVEGYPIAPAGLQLEQVHVYVRHGTPTAALFCVCTREAHTRVP